MLLPSSDRLSHVTRAVVPYIRFVLCPLQGQGGKCEAGFKADYSRRFAAIRKETGARKFPGAARAGGDHGIQEQALSRSRFIVSVISLEI